MRLRGIIPAMLGGLVLGCVAFSASAEERVALVLGNAAYESYAPLANPAKDAKLIGDLLEKAGFTTIRKTDTSLRGMRRALRDFVAKINEKGPDTVALIYYAGHGMQVDGTNYLIPVDAQIERASDVPIESLSLSDIMSSLQQSQSRMNLVILDACRNNPFQTGSRSTARGLALLDAPTGTLVAYATAPGSTAADGDKAANNSPYTRALAEMMQKPGKSIERVFKDVRIKVHKQTRGLQTPWESSSLTGEFVFFENQGSTQPAAGVLPGPGQKTGQNAAQNGTQNTNGTPEAAGEQRLSTNKNGGQVGSQTGSQVGQDQTIQNPAMDEYAGYPVLDVPMPRPRPDYPFVKTAAKPKKTYKRPKKRGKAKPREEQIYEEYIEIIEEDELAGYEEFIELYPQHPLAIRIQGLLWGRYEARFWAWAIRQKAANGFAQYLATYPNGPHAYEARLQMARLQGTPKPAVPPVLVAPQQILPQAIKAGSNLTIDLKPLNPSLRPAIALPTIIRDVPKPGQNVGGQNANGQTGGNGQLGAVNPANPSEAGSGNTTIFVPPVIKTPLPGIIKPGIVKPGILKPGILKPGTVIPGIIKPGIIKPGLANPGIKRPIVKPPRVSVPGIKRPIVKPPRVKVPGIKRPIVKPPRVKVPGIKRPIVKPPRVKVPGIKRPIVKPPRVKVPGIKRPIVKPPRVKGPRIKRPRVNAPRIKAPRIKRPLVKPPRVKRPRVTIPRVNQPRIKKPRRLQPRITPRIQKPRFKPRKTFVPQRKTNKRFQRPRVTPQFRPQVKRPRIQQRRLQKPRVQRFKRPVRIQRPKRKTFKRTN